MSETYIKDNTILLEDLIKHYLEPVFGADEVFTVNAYKRDNGSVEIYRCVFGNPKDVIVRISEDGKLYDFGIFPTKTQDKDGNITAGEDIKAPAVLKHPLLRVDMSDYPAFRRQWWEKYL